MTLPAINPVEGLTKTAKPRLNHLDIAKGLGIMLVVVGHELIELKGLPAFAAKKNLQTAINVIYSFHMPLFFFLAGLMTPGAMKKRGPWEFAKSRALILLYPYLLWTLIMNGLSFLNGHGVPLKTVMYQLLADPYWFLWFLYVLFFLYLIYALLANRRYGIPILAVIAITLFLFVRQSGVNSRLPWIFGNSMVYFILGVILAGEKVHAGINRFSSIPFCAAALGLFILGAWRFHDSPQSTNPGVAFYLALTGIAATLLGSARLQQFNFFSFLKLFGRLSMPIYLGHCLVLILARRALFQHSFTDSFWLQLTVASLLGLLVPVIVYQTFRAIGWSYVFEIPGKSEKIILPDMPP